MEQSAAADGSGSAGDAPAGVDGTETGEEVAPPVGDVGNTGGRTEEEPVRGRSQSPLRSRSRSPAA
eukprot:7832603-Karenia_brevis.AAC.1